MDTTLPGTLTNTLPSTTPPTPTPVPKSLTVPSLTGNIGTDIGNLTAAKAKPDSMVNFQRVMAMSSRLAYKERQKEEMANLNFDPSKVSGQTFASIIGQAEQNRGEAVSKVHQAVSGTYESAQKEVERRLEYLQKLQVDKANFEDEYATDYKYAKKLKGSAKKKAKAQLEASKRSFDREYALSLAQAGNGSVYDSYALSDIRAAIESMAQDGYGSADIIGALHEAQIPTFPSSVANETLSNLFG